jgi:hypothetical protein
MSEASLRRAARLLMGLDALSVSAEVLRGVEDSDESSMMAVEDLRRVFASWSFFSRRSTRASRVAT